MNGPKIVTREMGFFCFDVLHSFLSNKPFPTAKFADTCYPLFVTWKVVRDQSLRGCVGSLSPLNLHSGLKEYAIISASKDHRFPPITLEELPQLQITVSLLTNFEEAKDYLDWTIGLHGIWITFLNEKGSMSRATYLPDFAAARGNDPVKTIDALLRKGGYQGTITEDFRKSIKLTRYQTHKVTVTYEEYKKAIIDSFCAIQVPQ